ncbi:dolichol phosphate-mannose biosynthesis regulatory protein-like [Branchiostoma lanceolatum]|uniref:Dolichol phosphate-mannose biosynthesis regulatory protein n=1 Tax=Branchiostoma lanceolatum TaxID=7740 RepID=A0A8K0ACP3_BRALA|nr:DPM2 [Branchiostoma lanceolatum]
MATGSDQAVGMGLVALSALIFTYYTIWTVVLPFVDDDHIAHQYFLPRPYAVIIPTVAGVVALSAIGSFFGYVMLQDKMKKKAK